MWIVNSRSSSLGAEPRIWGLWSISVLLTVSNAISIDTVVTTLAERPLGSAPRRPSWKLQGDSVEHTWPFSLPGVCNLDRVLWNKGGLGNSGYRERSLEGCAGFPVTMGSNSLFNYFETQNNRSLFVSKPAGHTGY